MNKELTKEQLIKRLAKLKPSNYLYWYAGNEFHAIYEYDKETDTFIGWGEQEEPLTFKYESIPTHLLKRKH